MGSGNNRNPEKPGGGGNPNFCTRYHTFALPELINNHYDSAPAPQASTPAQNPHMSQHLNQNHTNLALNLWYITQPQNRIVLTPNQHMFQSTSQKPKENPTFLAPEPNPNPGDGTRFQLLLNKPIFS